MSELIISTKCPVVLSQSTSARTVEILIKFIDNEPKKIICSRYNYGCSVTDRDCIYSKWSSLHEEIKTNTENIMFVEDYLVNQ